MFEVDAKGFAALHAGRPPWHFVRELISNAWDEKITTCEVTLEKEGRDYANLTVVDDGPGFADLKDAYTLFGTTPKQLDPGVRGRFNLGEKEMAAVAKEMMVLTTTGGVHFTKDRKLKRLRRKTEVGTVVSATFKWTQDEVAEIIGMLMRFISPAHVVFTVNGQMIEPPLNSTVVEGPLSTVLFKDDALRPTVRKTTIRVIEGMHGGDGHWLYEMGVPIQPIECPYHVDVMQKVPMSPNRENVSDAYLRDIYAYTLEAMSDDLEVGDVSEQWVRTGMEDEIVQDDTVETIREKRFPNAVLWSSDLEANQRALEDGKDVIHPRTMSPVERDRFQTVGMVHSSTAFGVEGRPIEPILDVEWTPAMRGLESLSQYLYRMLYGEPLVVNFIEEPQNNMKAGFRNNQLVFNMSRFGSKEITDKNIPHLLALLGHEFGHREGNNHDGGWINSALGATGRIIKIAMERPEQLSVK